MKRFVVLGLLLLFPLLAHATANRTLSADIPATGINTLALTVGVGELRITPSSDDAIHVQVSLEQKSRGFLWFFHWQSRATTQEIQAAQINHEQQDGRLLLSLTSPDELSHDDVKQKWTIQMPARLALDLDMKVGQVNISGVAGGVHADLNVGELNLNVPRGLLSAKINVGQISATSATAQPGDIELSSTIGEAALNMHGKFVAHAGEHSGLGRSIHISGSGPDSMNLSVNVGEVNLRIDSAVATTHVKH